MNDEIPSAKVTLVAAVGDMNNGKNPIRFEMRIRIANVITTGKSSREVIDLARSLGAEVVGALSIVCRSQNAPDLGVPVASLLNIQIDSFRPEECALCKDGVPLVKPFGGKKRLGGDHV